MAPLEVEKHTSKDDLWLLIDGKARSRPGLEPLPFEQRQRQHYIAT